MAEKTKFMGIIQNPRVGFDERAGVAFDLQIALDEAGRCGQYFSLVQMAQILKEYGVRDVKELHGKPCWFSKNGNEIIWEGSCVLI